MKIYPKIRFKYPVDAVYVITAQRAGELAIELFEKEEKVTFTLYPSFAIEFPDMGVVLINCDQAEGDFLNIKFLTTNKKGKICPGWESFANLEQTREGRTVLCQLCGVLQYITELTNPTTRATMLRDENRPEIWQRKGDTLRYRKLLVAEHVAYGREIAEVIRKRDHAVRGHWRHLASGKQTWITSHRRGDVALGTVHNIVTVE